MNETIQTTDGSVTTMVCPVCGAVYALGTKYRNKRIEDGASWYCPNGHSLSFTDSTKKKLERALAQRDEERRMREAAQADASNARKAQAATRTTLRKLRARVGAGVCPCCTRTFQQLARHMKSKHPHYRTRA